MGKHRQSVTTNGRAAFYASMYEDLKNAAISCGWALGLHGSLNSDMDIMAMPWDDKATSADEMIESLKSCFSDNKIMNVSYSENKPNNRAVYTLPIFGDFYLDVNIINKNNYNENSIDWIIQDWDLHNDQFKEITFEEYVRNRFKDVFDKYTGQ